MATTPRFTKRTLDFMMSAATQASPDWLDKHQSEHEEHLVAPLRALAEHLATHLADRPEARGYRMPRQGFGRLRRPSHKILAGQPAYRNWVHLQSARPAKSRFEDNPGLYFYLSTDAIFAGGGLHKSNSRQTRQLRAWLAEDPAEVVDLFKSKAFKKMFPRGFETDQILKTVPRFYPPDHRRIEWLRLTAFYVKQDFTKKEFYSAEFKDLVLENWRQTLRFNAAVYAGLGADVWQPPMKTAKKKVAESEDEDSTDPAINLWDERL